MAMKSLCSIPNCNKPSWARGWCSNHYQRWRLYGDPIAPSRARPRETCSVPECHVPCYGHGFCSAHYYRWKKYGDPLASLTRKKWSSPTCSVEGCDNPRKNGTGMCVAHYLRWWRHGDPEHGRAMVGEPEQFMLDAIASDEQDCILWPFGSGKDGRPNIRIPGEGTKIVSRIVCARVHGEPPTPGHEAAHSCGNGHIGCINPAHLRWATHLENGADMVAHGRSHRGNHPMAKLTVDDVRRVRSLHRKVPAAKLAAEYGVSRGTIYVIQRRVAWKWLD